MKKTIIYICGYGRSGSTLVDMALDQHPDIFGAGEISAMCRHVWRENEYCACRNRIKKCPVWGAVMHRWGTDSEFEHYLKLQHRIEPLFSLYRGLDRSSRRTYASMSARMFDIIREVTEASMIVDSSKAPGRGLALASTSDLDLRVIHLVRDPRAVAHAMARPIPFDVEKGVQKVIRGRFPLRTALRWRIYNEFAERLCTKVGAAQSVRVRYEDITRNPARELERIGRVLKLDLSSIGADVAAGKPIASHHQMAGSRLRMQDPMVLRPIETWRDSMSDTLQNSVYAMTRSLCRRYGYPQRLE